MDQGSMDESEEHTSLARKSWTAYAFVAIFMLPVLVLAVFAWPKTAIGSALLVIFAIAGLTYSFLYLKSYHLYYDEDGVWVYSGFLPWQKGVSGVKWRDLDEATFTPSFLGWLFKSYTIQVCHRFTKVDEIVFTHCAHGQDAVLAINEYHEEMIRGDDDDDEDEDC